MHASNMQWIGRTLTGTYKVDAQLGEGGQGSVFRGHNIRTGGAIAIKILSERMNNTIRRRFREEARTAAGLCHPNIVLVLDTGEESGFFFLAMELLEGVDLYHRVEAGGPLRIAEVRVLAEEIGSALHHAHQRGVIHRDVKPQNICFSNRSVGGRAFPTAKILDFGVAKAPRTTQITPEHALIGTPHYMPPEAALGAIDQVDSKSDLWSFAVVLYYALSGRLPFPAPDVMSILYAIIHNDPIPLSEAEAPAAVARVLERALSKQKSHRFSSVDEFVQHFCQATEPFICPPVAQFVPSWLRVATPVPLQVEPPRRRSPLRMMATATVAAAALGGAVLLGHKLGGAGRSNQADDLLPTPSAHLALAWPPLPLSNCDCNLGRGADAFADASQSTNIQRPQRLSSLLIQSFQKAVVQAPPNAKAPSQSPKRPSQAPGNSKNAIPTFPTQKAAMAAMWSGGYKLAAEPEGSPSPSGRGNSSSSSSTSGGTAPEGGGSIGQGVGHSQ